jgi:hypothetical protein
MLKSLGEAATAEACTARANAELEGDKPRLVLRHANSLIRPFVSGLTQVCRYRLQGLVLVRRRYHQLARQTRPFLKQAAQQSTFAAIQARFSIISSRSRPPRSSHSSIQTP